MRQGFTVWLTGPAGTGKAEIAAGLEGALLERGLDAERIDEAEILDQYLQNLIPEGEPREGLTRLIGHICHLLTRNGIIAVASAVSPRARVREELRGRIGRFVEVYVKGPSGKSGGETPKPTGTGSSYEEPSRPEILLDGQDGDPEASVKKILKSLEILEFIPRAEGDDYSEEEEQKITKRLKDLGYI